MGAFTCETSRIRPLNSLKFIEFLLKPSPVGRWSLPAVERKGHQPQRAEEFPTRQGEGQWTALALDMPFKA